MYRIYIEGGVIRKIWGVESHAYRDHLLRLDRESRHNRFSAEIDENMIRSYAATAHGPDILLHGFFVDGVLRGAADLRMVRPLDRQEAEAACVSACNFDPLSWGIGVHVWMPPKMQGVFWTARAVIGSVHVSGLSVRR